MRNSTNLNGDRERVRLIMKTTRTSRCVAVASLLFVLSGVAQAIEIYFPSFQRNSMIHFRNDTFIAEIPNPPEINGNPVCGAVPCVGTRSMTLGPDGKFYISSITTTDPNTGATDSSQGVVMVFDPSTNTFDPDPLVTGINAGPGVPFSGPTGIATIAAISSTITCTNKRWYYKL